MKVYKDHFRATGWAFMAIALLDGAFAVAALMTGVSHWLIFGLTITTLFSITALRFINETIVQIEKEESDAEITYMENELKEKLRKVYGYE